MSKTTKTGIYYSTDDDITYSDIIYYINTSNEKDVTRLVTSKNVNDIIDKKDGNTALHYAIKMNNDKIIKYLLEIGANPYIKTISGKDAFDLSIDFRNKFSIIYEQQKLKNITEELKKTIVSKDKKISDVIQNKKFLENNINEIIIKNDVLKQEVALLKKTNLLLKKSETTLFRENTKIQMNNTALSDNITVLNKTVNTLQASNLTLLKTNKDLSSELEKNQVKYVKLNQSFEGLVSKKRKFED